MENKIDLNELVGTVAGFYGAHSNVFKLGRTCYEAVEDESDGYRSMLDYVQEVPNPGGFFDKAIAKVRVEEDPNESFYKLVDVKSGHVWLTFGTNHADDYYPMFTFDYTPDGKKI